jgi:hypothetical protein
MVDREEHRAEDKTDTIITYYGVLKYQRHFMLSNLPNLYKKYDTQISKRQKL